MKTRPSVGEWCDVSMSCLFKKLTRLNLFSGSEMKLIHEEGRGTDALLMILRIGRATFVLIARVPALIDCGTYRSKATSVRPHVLIKKLVVCSSLQDLRRFLHLKVCLFVVEEQCHRWYVWTFQNILATNYQQLYRQSVALTVRICLIIMELSALNRFGG